jgi:hypothetical protein
VAYLFDPEEHLFYYWFLSLQRKEFSYLNVRDGKLKVIFREKRGSGKNR